MVIDMRSRPRSAFPRPTRPRTATPPIAPSDVYGVIYGVFGLDDEDLDDEDLDDEDLEDLEDLDDWTTISCDDCVMADSSACNDCVVTYLCPGLDSGLRSGGSFGKAVPSGGRQSNARWRFDDQETDTLRLLQAAGLAPALRHVARTSLVDHGSAHGPRA